MKRSKNHVIDLIAACIKAADTAYENGAPYTGAAKDGGVAVISRTASILLERALADDVLAKSLVNSAGWTPGWND